MAELAHAVAFTLDAAFSDHRGRLDHETLNRWLQSGSLLGGYGQHLLLGIGEGAKDSGTAFYAPDFFLRNASPWRYYNEYRWVELPDLLSAMESLPTRANTDWVWAPPSRVRFEELFRGLQTEISKAVLHKGVPLVFETARANLVVRTPKNTIDTTRLAAAIGSVLHYALDRPVIPYGFWWTDDTTFQGMLGCTPEILFQQDDGFVQTMAVAGTRLVSDIDRLPLIEDPKERREHQLVVDAIATELRPFGEVRVHATGVVQLAVLAHLKTLIDLEPRHPMCFETLVNALHPTPALGAFPKAAGWQWLERMERSNGGISRARFGAPFGAVWDGGKHSLCVVAIRNIQWQGPDALLCAGCGVIRQSVLEREWSELQGKIAAVKGILGL